MRFILIALALVTGSAYADWAKVTIDEVSTENQPIIEQALKDITYACPGFNKYWGDVETAHLDVVSGSEWDYRTTDFGWEKYLIFKVKIKDETQYLPNKYQAWGHTVRFYAGSGNWTGIVTKKPQSALFCEGFYPVSDNGDDKYLPVQNLKSLDKLL